AIALVVFVGGSANPSVLATASLATKGPVLPAPAEDQSNDSILKASVGGVPFPYWGESFQWEAAGGRKAAIDGPTANTVFYANPKGAQAAYTTLDGKKLDPPKGARVITQRGTKLWVTQHDGRRIVVWTRGGHTCVLSAPKTIPESKML